MAAKGNYAAFKRLKPTDGLSTDIQKQQQFAFKRRQEDRIEENIEYQRAQAKKKSDRDFYDKYVKPYDTFDSKSRTVNEGVGKLLLNGQREMGRQAQIMDNAEIGSDEYLQAKLSLENLYKIPEKIKSFISTRTKQYEKIKKLAEEGKIHETDEVKTYFKNYQNQLANVDLGFDEQYNPVVAFTDENGDGISDTDSFQSLVKGKLPVDATPVIDFESRAKLLSEEVGTKDETTQSGRTTTKTSKPKMARINQKADQYFSVDEDGNLTREAKSALIQAGYSREKGEWNKQNLNKLKDAFIEDVRSRVDEEFKQTTKIFKPTKGNDSPGKNRVTPTEPVIATPSTYSNFSEIIPEGTLSVGVSQGQIKLPAIRNTSTDSGDEFLSNVTVLNVTYDEEGRMIADVSYEDSKSNTYTAEDLDFIEKQIKKEERKMRNAEKGTDEYLEAQEEKERYGLQLDRLKEGAKNVRTDIRVSAEDESKIANYFGGIDELKNLVKPTKEETNEPEVDEYGVPIN